jgi:uncharacterized membrane protein YphA (DoxX/SURF4 family)
MKKYVSLFLKYLAAVIMLQTLLYKFSAASESVDLFTQIAGTYETYARIGTGILELIASILLFTPKKTWLGALLTIGLMTGALFSHIVIIGIEHNKDGGTLFILAFITLISSAFLLYFHRKEIPSFKLK